MITILVTPGKRGGPDRAHCQIDGRTFEAESARGSVPTLCRVLVRAGIPDQPWEMVNTSSGHGKPSVFGPSIQSMALYRYSEKTGQPALQLWKAWDSARVLPPISLEPVGEHEDTPA